MMPFVTIAQAFSFLLLMEAASPTPTETSITLYDSFGNDFQVEIEPKPKRGAMVPTEFPDNPVEQR